MLHFFYEIAYNDFIDCILKSTMFPDLKYEIKIILIMNLNYHILKLLLLVTGSRGRK